MPNHITNVIEIESLNGVELSDVRATFVDDEGFVNFNVITPVPEGLQDFEPHSGVVYAAKALAEAPIEGNLLLASLEIENRAKELNKYKTPEELGGYSQEERDAIDRAVNNIHTCGYAYWYDWNVEHWGTKWNAYGQSENGHPQGATRFTFETAWNHPDKLIKKMSEKNPAVEFSIKYADEDTGSNCGSYTIINGEVSNKNIAKPWGEQTDEEKKENTKFAFELRYSDVDPRSHGYDENWIYSDEVYEAYEAEKVA